MTDLQTPVGWFRDLRRKGQNRPLGEILNEIKTGTFTAQVERIRHPGTPTDEKKRLKALLPAFMVSGTTTNGSHTTAGFGEHSGLLQCDLDHVGSEQAPRLRDKLGLDPYCFASFVSPSGDGVKLLLRIRADSKRHLESYKAAESYFREQYGLVIDPSRKDLSGVCYVSSDEKLVLNLNASQLPVVTQYAEHSNTDELKGERARKNPEKVQPSPFSEEPENEFSTHWFECPKLRRIYYKRVAGLFSQPTRGMRNATISAMVPPLAFMVAPQIVKLMVSRYVTDHAAIFTDYDKKALAREVHSLIQGTLATFEKGLSDDERELYIALPGDHQTAFRLCRSLAFYDGDDDQPPPRFFMGYHELAARTGRLAMESSRIMKSLVSMQVLELVKNGDKLAKGQRANASEWRWIMTTPATTASS